MNRLATHIEFEADFPADLDPMDENLIGPGGRELIAAVGAMLDPAGFTVSAPGRHSWYGWDIVAMTGGLKLWLMVQYPEPWLLIADDRSGLLAKLRGRSRRPYADALDRLEAAMKADPRFRQVRRCTREEYERPNQG